MTPFYNYLVQKRLTLKTAHIYQKLINQFEDWAKANDIKPQKATYNELLDYITYCKSIHNTPQTINKKNVVLKHYFDFLERPNNPAEELRLKGVTRLLPKNPLSKEELENIYHKYSDYDVIRKRNKVMLGFVVFQGVSSTELAQLTLENIDLERGTIYIKSGHRSNSRTIELKAFQLLSIQNYILKIRPLLLQKTNKQTDQFFVTIGMEKRLGGVIAKIIKAIKKIEPKVQNFQHIRTSVITSWIKENGLRKAQYLAGHRYVSSTEHYEVNYLDDLKKNIELFHPLST